MIGTRHINAPRAVRAKLGFLGPCTKKPVFHDGCEATDYLPIETHEVLIEDARPMADGCSLDREGFVIERWPSRVCDFFSAAGRAEYLREVERLIVELTGAAKAVALANGVIRRSERAEGYLQHGTTVPGRFVHCDFSIAPAGSRFWVEQLLPAEEACARLQRRFAIYNVWRCLSQPPQDAPLALCDARSVLPRDAVGCDQILSRSGGQRIEFELSLFRFNARQRWYYFPDMRPEEALVFKGFDSDPRRAGGVPHAAFDLPGVPNGVAGRMSIDERVVAFFA